MQRITGYGVGAPSIKLNPPPIISTRNPATTDTRFPLGQNWVNKSTASAYQLCSVSAGVATWVAIGGGSSALATLTGNTGGALSPTAGNINILGAGALSFAGSGSTLTGTITPGAALVATINSLTPTAGNIIIAGTANQVAVGSAGSTVTLSTPATFIAPGSIAATTTVTATLGNITATNGNIVRGTAGNKDVYTSVASTPTAGANSAGTVTLTGGTATITTTAVTAASQIRLYRQGIGATGAAALGILTLGTVTPATSFVIRAVQAADATALQASDVSVIGWEIVN
jgi:hypothetical protein